MYYRGAMAAIVVYDVTNPTSFEGAKSWVRELQRRGDPHVVIAMAANKCDKEGMRKVEEADGQQYAKENNIIHLATSAKSGHNVKELFLEIAKRLPKAPVNSGTGAKDGGFPIPPVATTQSGCCKK